MKSTHTVTAIATLLIIVVAYKYFATSEYSPSQVEQSTTRTESVGSTSVAANNTTSVSTESAETSTTTDIQQIKTQGTTQINTSDTLTKNLNSSQSTISSQKIQLAVDSVEADKEARIIAERIAKDASSTVPFSDDAVGVIRAFILYRTAIINSDGPIIASYLSSNSLQYYDEMLRLIKEGEIHELLERRFIDRLLILMSRSLLDRTSLLQCSDGREFLALVGTSKLMNKGQMSELDPSMILDVNIHGDFGSLTFAQPNTNIPNPYSIDFIKENGEWKLEIMSLLTIGNMTFLAIINYSGFTENEFITSMIESISGVKPDDTIWQPLTPQND